ncbi:CHAT domain-containing protein [Streptomyces netropsis]|uniref:caspase, EACC1-associated type n=1 Tax=Streptomyces netropsis TaxID=55404 RepID=UPI003793DC93
MRADPAHSRAVLIGTYHFEHLEDLPSVKNNLDRLLHLLTDPDVWGLAPEHCVVLRQPTSAAEVADAVEAAAAEATDTLLVYFAGHGLTAPRTMELGLALVGSRANAPHTTLPFEWIRQAVLDAEAPRKVVLLDCCYSGRALTGGMAGVTELVQDAEIEGTYILVAAAETKKALAPVGERYTAFTGELIAVLETGVAGEPEYLSMSVIHTQVHTALARKGRPIPQQRNRNSAALIAFARNHAYLPPGAEPPAEPPEDAARLTSLAGLADALRLEAQSTGSLAALDDAIALCRQAVAGSRPDSADHASYLAGLGDALRLKSETAGDREALLESVTVLRDAVTAAPEGSPHRATCLTALGNALRLRAHATGDSGALSEAVENLRAAVEASGPRPLDQAASLLSLGGTLWGAAQTDGGSAALDGALASWEHASRIEQAPAHLRIEAAGRSGRAAIERGEIARGDAGLTLAVNLLPELASWHIDLIDRERLLSDFLGLASDAAACKLMLDAPAAALHILERGRGVLFSKLLELRPDLGVLRSTAPELATEFEELARDLSVDWLTLGAEPRPPHSGRLLAAEGEAADARHRAARHLEELIARIRTLPGLGEFLQPLPADRLLDVGKDAPVVVVNVSRYRSDALILTGGGLRVVPLPHLEAQAVHDRVNHFLGAVREPGQGGGFESRVARQQTVLHTLEWLWDAMAEPVLRELGHDRAHREGEPWPRLFWCPTGLLSLLPLHAAGYHGPAAADAPSRTVMDRVVSSYTTTVRDLLLGAAEQTVAHDGPSAPAPDPLVVLPNASGAPALPGAEREARFLTTRFPAARLLSGREATWAAVRRALPTRRWAHFACHAMSDLDHPLNSGLLLTDRMVPVRDICRTPLDSVRLVVLSGCGTSQTGTELADEAIHIASAFQTAGARHVIGTLWPIVDEIAEKFATLFYARLASGTTDPAFALHVATRELRDAYPAMPVLWASLTHLGPSRATTGESLTAAVPDEGEGADDRAWTLLERRPLRGDQASGAFISRDISRG